MTDEQPLDGDAVGLFIMLTALWGYFISYYFRLWWRFRNATLDERARHGMFKSRIFMVQPAWNLIAAIFLMSLLVTLWALALNTL